MEHECCVCLDAAGAMCRKGCACRGTSAFVHFECALRSVVAQLRHRGEVAWHQCQTCKQSFTGEMCVALADAWLERVTDEVERQRALNYRALAIGGMARTRTRSAFTARCSVQGCACTGRRTRRRWRA